MTANTGSRAVRSMAGVAAIAIFAPLLAGCSHGPESAAQDYLNNLKLFNYPACYQTISHQDKLDRTLEQFLTDPPMTPSVSKEWFKSVVTATEYVPGAAKVEGDRATVPIKVTMPDLELWERAMNTVPTTKASAESQAQTSLQNGTFPKVTFEDTMVMVKQGNDWPLVVNYPLRERIAKMHKEAVELYHKHDYDKAIAAYREIIAALDKEPATGQGRLKFLYGSELADIQKQKGQLAEAQAYVPKLVLADVDLKMAASRVPGIFGKIANTGDRALDEVEMTVNYSTGRGKRKKLVYTEVHTPIATPLTFQNFTRPVLPFVPGETRNFGFRLSAPVEVQEKATPDLVITAIAFTESKAPLPTPATPTPSATAAAASPTPGAASSPAAAAPPPMPK